MSGPISLPISTSQASPRRRTWVRTLASLALFLLLSGGLYALFSHVASEVPLPHHGDGKGGQGEVGGCPRQPAGKRFVNSTWPASFEQKDLVPIVRRFQRAIALRTESFSELAANPSDPRWEATREPFLAFLEKEFPTVFASLESERVNKYGLVMTWKGREEGLKPVLLMAHYDTAPVDESTLAKWDYPPFEGHVTEMSPEGWIYGRGARDCKNNVISILSAIERLLAQSHTPQRTIVLSFGQDEEIGGFLGAGHIEPVLRERYGEKSFALVFDEGSQGVDDEFGLRLASMAMTEKGSAAVKLQVDTPGGHSSVAPKHTGIGYLSMLINQLENNPPPRYFTPSHPLMRYYQCAATYAPDMDSSMRSRIVDQSQWPALAEELSEDDMMRGFLATSWAADVVHAGNKYNALVEKSVAEIDSRLVFDDTVAASHERLVATLLPVVQRQSLAFSAFGHAIYTPKGALKGNVTLTALSSVEPPKITKADTAAWDLVAATVRGVWGEETIVAPKAMLGGTDGRKMERLTDHTYRFMPALMSETSGAHGTNEVLKVKAHLSTQEFFYNLMGNLEGWQSD